MFVIIGRCVKCKNRIYILKVKVTIYDLRSTLSISGYMSCPVHYLLIDKGNLKIHGTNVHTNENMCHAQQLVAYIQVQDNTWWAKIYIVCYGAYFVSDYNFFIDIGILKLLSTNVFNNTTMCPAQHVDLYIQCQCQTCKSKLHIVCCSVYFVSSS
jgi:hypothetical protein